jgi:hypothetical protein
MRDSGLISVRIDFGAMAMAHDLDRSNPQDLEICTTSTAYHAELCSGHFAIEHLALIHVRLLGATLLSMRLRSHSILRSACV